MEGSAMIDKDLIENKNGEYWYAVQREEGEAWDTGNENWEEALQMCHDRVYKYISVIQDSCYIEGKFVPNNNPVCIATYTTIEAVKR